MTQASPTAPYTVFQIERQGEVALVRMVSQNGLNLMGPAFWRELPQVFGELSLDDTVRVVVLASLGRHFTAGLDLANMMPELQSPKKGRIPAQQHLLRVIHRLQAAISSLEACPHPVIAAVHGQCIGGGVDLITAADIRLCSAEAKFSVREARVAIVADLGTLQRLPRIVGEGHARELVYTAADISAQRAGQIGLVSHVYDTPEVLMENALEMARTIAANSPLAVRGSKTILNHSRDHSVAEGLEHVALFNANFVMSDDLIEAMSAFMQKRPPVYKGT